jgi:hypothetical protein
MHSRLATQLIGLEHGPGEHSDMIWKYASLADVEHTQTPISDTLVKEMVLFLEGDQAKKFASLLPDLQSLRTALDSRSLAALRRGAAENPHADDELLESIAAAGGEASKIAMTRLQNRSAFSTALSNNNDDDIALNYENMSFTTDVQAIASRLSGYKSVLQSRFGSDRRYPFRSMVLRSLDFLERDQICSEMIGVLDSTSLAELIDESLASWLVDSTTTRAEASRSILISDKRSLKAFTSRLTDAAMYRVLASDELGGKVREIISNRVTRPHAGYAQHLDRSMLSTLRLAGMGVDEVSSLIFSSQVALEPHELVRELEGIESHRLAMYFGGQCARRPQHGEVDALLAARDLEEQEQIAVALGSEIKDLPWYDELLIGIPRSFVPVDDNRSARIMDSFLVSELGNDARAWEVVLSMSGEWEGSLRALTNAAQQL